MQLKLLSTLFTIFVLFNQATTDDTKKEPVAAPAAAEFATFKEPGDLIALTKDNFDTEIKKTDWAMVMFYAPWISCECCVKYCAAYKETATALKSKNLPITLAVLDCVANKVVCDKVKVGGFPVLKIFQKGEVYSTYESSGKTKETLIPFIEYLVKPEAAAATTP